MKYLFAALTLCCCAAAQDQPDPPRGLPVANQVDQAEVLRHGDRAVVAGEGPRSAGELLYSLAMAPPADDSDQWYVTIFGASKDAATLGVLRGFERVPHLAAFVAAPPGEGRRPWAHLNVYFADDPMQAFRFKEFGIPTSGPFPIVVIQPPRDGSFGGLVASEEGGKKRVRTAVVDRIEAAQLGQPADLQKRITASVALWCKKLEQSGFVPPAKVAAKYEVQDRRLAHSDSHNQAGYPWGPAAPPAQPSVNPQWPAGGPAATTEAKLTLEQIKRAAPDAPERFWIEQYEKGYTDPDKVTMAWLIYKLDHKNDAKPEGGSPNAQPAQTPAPVTPGGFLGNLAAYAMVLIAGLKIWEMVAPMLGFPGTAAKTLREILEKLQQRSPVG